MTNITIGLSMVEGDEKKSSSPLRRLKGRMMGKEKSIEDDGSDTVSVKGVHMRRNVSLMGGISLVGGTMIGSGIFISPKGVLRNSGSIAASLIIWVACGVISMLGAFSYSELGTLIPKSGGEYAYFLAAFSRYGKFCGPLPAYLYVWCTVMVNKPTSLAVICLAIATYSIQPFFGSCNPPLIAIKILAAVFIVLVTAWNSFSVKLATKLQNFFMVAKVLALVSIIIGGVVKLSYGSMTHLGAGFDGTTTSPSMIAIACYSGLFAYDGWNNLNFVTEEIKNPKRNLPLAIMISITLVMFCYVFTNVSYFTVLSKEEFLATDAVAVSWAKYVLGPASVVIPIAVCLSALGAANGSCFTGGRLSFAAARDSFLPSIMEMIHVEYRTPIPSLLWNAFLALIYLIIGDIYTLIDCLSFLTWAFYGLTMVSLLILRRHTVDDHRSYKVPLVIPILFLIIAVCLVFLPILHNPHLGFLYSFLFTVSGVFLYIPFVYKKVRIPKVDKITKVLQIMLSVVPTDYVKDS
ncbi:b(0,+)-type amino acid transporter 1-like isoform X2 [Lineus longissimus]|uniref:b(0,+)-type amino acid transporter 1-like isoform X2 n=1 Tax=Lineus longissimus TaxID=88925 RepID=UPI00315D85A4